ncbi:hypothetical protein KBC99_03180 [Candidatus Saccharibacteria bacterium]|nr:hypothetical protein [Candidatus Saccharibacteria bacterium]
MPAKTAPKTKGSNIAKSALNLKTKFNPKLLIAIILVIVATLGFIYIFFSKAGSETQYIYDLRSNNSNTATDTIAITKVGYTHKEPIKTVAVPNSSSIFKSCSAGGFTFPSELISNEKARILLITSQRCNQASTSRDVIIPVFDTSLQAFSGNITANLRFDDQWRYAIDGTNRKLYIYTSIEINAYDLNTKAFIRKWAVPEGFDELIVSADGSIITALVQRPNGAYNAISYNASGTEIIRKLLNQMPIRQYNNQDPGQNGAIVGTDFSFILTEADGTQGTVTATKLNQRTLTTEILQGDAYMGAIKNSGSDGYARLRTYGGASGRVYLISGKCVSVNNNACQSYMRLNLATMKAASFGKGDNTTTRFSAFTESLDNTETLYLEHSDNLTNFYRVPLNSTSPWKVENNWNYNIGDRFIMPGSVIPESTPTTTTTPSTTGTTTPTPTGTTVAPPPSGNTTN